MTTRDRGWAVLLVVAVLVAYWPALHGAMLWDDAAHVTRTDLRSLAGLWRIWFDLGATQQYYPLLHSAFWVEHRLWGDATTGYHLLNVLLHASSALILCAILRRLEIAGAWIAAFAFALHPVHVESVAWISEQKNTLSTVFYLAAAWLYLRFDRSREWRQYAMATALFLCALLTKSTTATLPAALLVVFWWQRGSLSWRRDVTPLLSWLIAGVAAGVFTAWVEHTYIGAQGESFALTVPQHVLLAGRIAWFYAVSLIWPVGLTFNYPRWQVDPQVWWQWISPVALVVALGACWRLRARSRGPLAAALFFLGTLTPALGIVNVYPFVYSFVADHFQYIASLGVIVPLGWGIARATSGRRGRLFREAGVAALVLALGALTFLQSTTYRDVETLYTSTIARNPRSWMAYENLGILLAARGRLSEAIDAFRQAERIRPDRVATHRNLAIALSQVPGREQEAVDEYEAILRLDRLTADDHQNLARLLLTLPGREAAALTQAQAALRLDPTLAGAHYSAGNALQRLGRSGAVDEYRAALRLNPDLAEAHLNLGVLFAEHPETLEQALREYDAALAARPDYAEAHYNMGSLLMDVPGGLDRAIEHLQAAVRLRPDLAQAHSNLGLALSEMPGRRDEAVAHLREALRIDPSLAPPRALLERLEQR